MSSFLIGVFVGGRARRLGGVPKGLLLAPDTGEPLVARLARVCRDALPESELVLVGDAREYAHLGHDSIDDAPSGIGPIGALGALLGAAARTHRDAIALAADLPFVTRELVARLAGYAPDATAVAPRIEGLWQPLFARYRAERCLEVTNRLVETGERALHRVLSQLGPSAVALPVSPEEVRSLRDWDTPDDVLRR